MKTYSLNNQATFSQTSVGSNHLVGEEGEALGREIGVGKLGEQDARIGSQDADGRVHGGNVRHVHLGPQVIGHMFAYPAHGARLLNGGGNHHVAE